MVEERGLDFTAYLTWLVIGIPSLTWLIRDHAAATPAGLTWMACYIAFIVLFFFHERAGLAGVAAQSILAVTCCFLQPSGFQPVLLVIVAAQLAAQALKVAIPWIIAQTVAVALSAIQYDKVLLVIVGYFGFELFGFFAARIANRERYARLALATANAELKVATELLEMNSRTAERLRIARELHDLLGHHLAALSINLEVARHHATGDVRDQIEKSQAVTKLLLSDVRDVVSRLREDEPIDLQAAMASLAEVIHKPALHFEVDSDLAVRDSAVAQVALRALQEIVTNAVRHSGARNLWLKVTTRGDTLAIEARDDGCGTDTVSFGNGLRGMRERVEEARGTIEVASMRGDGFKVNVRLPIMNGTSAVPA